MLLSFVKWHLRSWTAASVFRALLLWIIHSPRCEQLLFELLSTEGIKMYLFKLTALPKRSWKNAGTLPLDRIQGCQISSNTNTHTTKIASSWLVLDGFQTKKEGDSRFCELNCQDTITHPCFQNRNLSVTDEVLASITSTFGAAVSLASSDSAAVVQTTSIFPHISGSVLYSLLLGKVSLRMFLFFKCLPRSSLAVGQ